MMDKPAFFAPIGCKAVSLIVAMVLPFDAVAASLDCTGLQACIHDSCRDDKVTQHKIEWDEAQGRLIFSNIGYPTDDRILDLLPAKGMSVLHATGFRAHEMPVQTFVLFDNGSFHYSVHGHMKGLGKADTHVVTLFGTCDMKGIS